MATAMIRSYGFDLKHIGDNMSELVGYTWKYKEILKNFGSYNKETKVWLIQDEKLEDMFEEIDEFKEEQDNKAKDVWKKACNIHKVEFCKKGTPVYDKVKKTFIDLIKNA